ncbi:MAG TPA: hypothetical protein VFW64_04635 [Pseudonocardiaceae bacterium]|nr:hypothetical protein [Pseudonocardiaceae bacterium]
MTALSTWQPYAMGVVSFIALIALVQPILVLELGFTLLLAGAVFHSRLHQREWQP